MAEALPEVSVIVPAYNVTGYIGHAVDSVLSQTFQNFEIVVVNDGCPDTEALERVLEPYQSRIRYIKQANRGLSGACNTAVRAARAPLIVHLDPDDWFEPDCLEEQVRIMREHPEYEGAYCNSFMFGEGPLAGRQWMDVFPSTGPVSFVSVMESRTCPTNPGCVIRRDALLKIGLYDETIRSWEDFDVTIRILKADPPGKIGYNTRPLVQYRQRVDSLTKQARYMEYALAVLEKAARDFDLSPEESASLKRRMDLVRHDVETARGKRAIGERRWKDAIRSFEYCKQYRPASKTLLVLFLLRTFPWALPTGLRAWEYYLSKQPPRDNRNPAL